MYESYISDFFRSVWDAVSVITTTFPGGIDYGRKSGTGTPYARYTVAAEKSGHESDQKQFTTYRLNLEAYAAGPTLAVLKDIHAKLDGSLLTALKAAAGASVGSGSGGEPAGKVNYVWRAIPPAGDGGSLLTEEERRSGQDVQVIKWAVLVRVQWT